MKKMNLISLLRIAILLLLATPVKAEPIDDPCVGPSALLNVIDRPTVSDSACAIKPGTVLIEAGYEYQNLYGVGGHSNFLPQVEFRLGLPFNNEFVVLPSNYVNDHLSNGTTVSGSTATVFGLKHEIGYTKKWIYTVEGIFTMPSGNSQFGSDGWGVTLNGVINYNITPAIALTTMLGISSLTDPAANGGGRFNSFNPDIVLSWQLTPKSQIFGEVYGQTHTSAFEGSGYNADVGLQYLITPQIEIDAEYV